MHALSINSLHGGKVSLGATGQTTKLHLIPAATLKKPGGPQVKLQNYSDFDSLYKGKGSLGDTGQSTKLHPIPAATLKKSGGPKVKHQNYTDFESMPYQLILFIREKGH